MAETVGEACAPCGSSPAGPGGTLCRTCKARNQKTVWSSRSLRFPAQPPIEECQLEGQRPLQCYD
jgi:hypothetical protein